MSPSTLPQPRSVKLSPDLSYKQAHGSGGVSALARLAATRAFYRHQPRWLKRRVVKAISRLLSDLLFRLALLTNEDPEFDHLHKQVCVAIKSAQDQTTSYRYDYAFMLSPPRLKNVKTRTAQARASHPDTG